MEPRIQYAQTKDDVSIAFWKLGEGMPLVFMPGVVSHVQMEWQIPMVRQWLEALAQKTMLVRYDRRGSGLSQRDVTDYSLDALVLDLEAVVDRLGLERFALYAPGHAGPVAIAYAARHPERVSHLLLWCSFPRGSDFGRSSRAQAIRAVRVTDWELFTEMVDLWAGLRLGEEERRAGVALIREAVSWESYRAFMEAGEGFDVTDLLSQVRPPTLVLHRREVAFPEVGVARELASRIPDARLALLEGTSPLPVLGDTEAVLSAIDEFLGEGEEAAAGAEPPDAGAFRTVLFTDVEGSTAFTQRLGDARARELLREHERIVREALKALGGAEVKTMGDGFMTSFSSATKALECAIAMQRAFADWNQGVGVQHAAPEPIRVRIGLNAGEPIAEEDPDGRSDLYGTAVNRAARITATAQGGEILVANVVRELAEGKDFQFADRGDVALKGFDEPVSLYEVRWQD